MIRKKWLDGQDYRQYNIGLVKGSGSSIPRHFDRKIPNIYSFCFIV